ncbi:hypothetical protein GCM10027610_057990 [Dactylosporangium cerinum]
MAHAPEDGAAAAALFTRLPPDWNDYWMVGTLIRDAVRRVSEFLVDTPLDPQTGRQLPLRRGISIGDQYLVVTVRR